MSLTRTAVSEVPLPCSAKRNRILFRAVGVVPILYHSPAPPLLRLFFHFPHLAPVQFSHPPYHVTPCLSTTATVLSCVTICYFVMHLATPYGKSASHTGWFLHANQCYRNWVFRKSLVKSDCWPHRLACMSVSPPVRIEQSKSRTGFREISYLEFLLKLATHNIFDWNLTYVTDLLTYLLTYLLAYSMEQSPSWEANRFCS